MTHHTNTVKINASNVSDKKNGSPFYLEMRSRQTYGNSCYTQLLSSVSLLHIYFCFTRKNYAQPSALIERFNTTS